MDSDLAVRLETVRRPSMHGSALSGARPATLSFLLIFLKKIKN